MEKFPKNLSIIVMDNMAIESITFNDFSAFIKQPIYNVDSKNSNSVPLSKLRLLGRKSSEVMNIPVFYINHDLADEAIRIKKQSGVIKCQ